MSNPIDVGSVLGGRYKVTATVLTSHDHDLVLDGVDQVLNRPVSILVAGPENTEQVAQSAREVATGERPGSVQVLDLGVTEDATYLITNHTSAADLLDLVVAANPPYVEPFFTDTLGSEIFGQARSHEPEPYDDDEDVDAGYIDYSSGQPRQVSPPRVPQPRVSPPVPPKPPARPTAAPAAGGAAGVAGAAGAGAAAGAAAASASVSGRTDAHTRPVERTDVPSSVPSSGGRDGEAGKPKVSLWSGDDFDQAGIRSDADDEPQERNRPGILARAAAPAAAARAAFENQGDYEDDEPQREPRSMRWLVGGLLAVVLITGLIFALTNLGGLFTPEPRAVAPAGSAGATTGEGSPSATATEEPTTAAPTVPPAIDSISRQGDFEFAANFDGDLVKAYDGNDASYWSDMEFATDAWGGLAPNGVPLVVKLKNPATVSSITLTQLGGSGGNITVYTNDRPSLDGAKAVGTNSFTSTDLNMPLAEPVEAQYVIVSINSLPKLAAPKTRYGYGLRLAEVKVQ
ncbi:discoidin domain-containing protein [Pseudarthrobacter sp. NPDC092424]|uniref:discoidin domain-containing protein n=1 Tax=Pseudarthrobacter sp. NPDC092424 TaxID=3364415 RepID=UPI0038202AB8